MLNQKVVVVAGGAGLLGRRFCEAVAEQGGIAVVADRDYAAAAKVAGDINAVSGARAEAAAIDITDRASIDSAIEDLRNRHQLIDAFVNSAYPRNGNYGRKLEEVSYADFCENVGLHLAGYFLAAQRFGLYFRSCRAGNIVNLASIYGTMVPRFQIYADTGMTMPVEYAAIKSGVIQLTKYFAEYFKKDGVRVNALSPGGVRDRQSETFLQNYRAHCGKKGMLDAQDITGSLVYLLSDASRYVTGQNLIVDDGFSL